MSKAQIPLKGIPLKILTLTIQDCNWGNKGSKQAQKMSLNKQQIMEYVPVPSFLYFLFELNIESKMILMWTLIGSYSSHFKWYTKFRLEVPFNIIWYFILSISRFIKFWYLIYIGIPVCRYMICLGTKPLLAQVWLVIGSLDHAI